MKFFSLIANWLPQPGGLGTLIAAVECRYHLELTLLSNYLLSGITFD